MSAAKPGAGPGAGPNVGPGADASGRLRILILGLSITSAWGNGHATTWRALVKALVARGHDVLFLERDRPWYAANRDQPHPPFGRTVLYADLDTLHRGFEDAVAGADLVIVGSYVPDGIAVLDWVLDTARGAVAVYDIDTPITVEALAAGHCAYVAPHQLPRLDLYFSFTGGPLLTHLMRDWGVRRPIPLYCAVDPDLHPMITAPTSRWDLGCLATYAADRQKALDTLLLEPARRLPDRRFVIAGAQYPPDMVWPEAVDHLTHVAPNDHAAFYGAQRLTLNITREAMRTVGWSPSVRLFEAAACGTPIISDRWPGIDCFFVPDREILLAATTETVVMLLRGMSDGELKTIARNARRKVLSAHTASHRAMTVEESVAALPANAACRTRARPMA